MIKVFSEKAKDKIEIIAVATHQRDLNNLRYMSYNLNDGKDKVQLNKDKYGGPYLKFGCDQFKKENGDYDLGAIAAEIASLQKQYD